eukprot:scaffold1057_cov194-Skeletonema_menzelii.AAC.5
MAYVYHAPRAGLAPIKCKLFNNFNARMITRLRKGTMPMPILQSFQLCSELFQRTCANDSDVFIRGDMSSLLHPLHPCI